VLNNRAIITWQPVLTDHQAYTYQALERKAGMPVISFVTSMEDINRKKQGWSDTKVISLERRLIPSNFFLLYSFQQLWKYRSNTHIFASPFQQPRLILCIIFAALLRLEFYLISEPYSPQQDGYLSDTSKLLGKIKVVMRPILYRCYALILRSRIAGIFTISPLALSQYKHAGIPVCKLFPFGYFIPIDDKVNQSIRISKLKKRSDLHIIFVGSLIRRKGIDLLQKTVKLICDQGYKITLDIFGPGNADSLCSNHKSIRYYGKIPFGKAQRIISQYDLLVLPSHYDGWGVVINEALCAGIPVVCSDNVGAGSVAELFRAGMCFTSGDIASLNNILVKLIKKPALLQKMKVSARLAAESLQPDVAANYMLNVIRASADFKEKIPSPWTFKKNDR